VKCAITVVRCGEHQALQREQVISRENAPFRQQCERKAAGRAAAKRLISWVLGSALVRPPAGSARDADHASGTLREKLGTENCASSPQRFYKRHAAPPIASFPTSTGPRAACRPALHVTMPRERRSPVRCTSRQQLRLAAIEECQVRPEYSRIIARGFIGQARGACRVVDRHARVLGERDQVKATPANARLG